MNQEDLRIKEEFINLFKQAKDCKGFNVYKYLSIIRIAVSVYYENYQSFKKSTQEFYFHENLINENSIKRWRRQKLIIKDVHNLISSAQSYFDYLNGIESQSFIPELKIRQINEELNTKPICQFVRSLRNFIIHNQILPLISVKAYPNKLDVNNDFVRYESIDKRLFDNYLSDRILNPKNIKDKIAKDYLDNMPPKINLNIILEEFTTYIKGFHQSIVIQIVTGNKDSLVDFLNKVHETHRHAEKYNLNKSIPVTQSQERHLKYLIYKTELN
jgi:hypothetical protein